jgi:hypothetical protein
MMTTAIKPATRPYSTAVTPESLTKRRNKLLIAYSLLAQSGQSIGDRLELALDFRPERCHGADDDNSDQAGDKAILDGRDTGLIIDEAAKQMTRKLNSWGYLSTPDCLLDKLFLESQHNKQTWLAGSLYDRLNF